MKKIFIAFAFLLSVLAIALAQSDSFNILDKDTRAVSAGQITGVIPVTSGGTGMTAMSGLATGNGTSAMSPYSGTSCTNQFTRGLSSMGVATCSSVALGSDVSGALPNTSVSGLGTMSTQSANTVAIIGGSISGISPAIPVASGGTGSTTSTGTGSIVLSSSPSLITPNLGTPSSGVATNLTGTASGLTAGTVTTNANLSGPIASTGNTTSVTSQTGTGSTFVMQTSPTLITPNIGSATASSLTIGGASVLPALSATTGSIGGGLLAIGGCTSGTVAVTNSTTSMTVSTSPNTYPGDGIVTYGYVSSNGTVTVKVCAVVAATPTASTYNVRVIQ